VHENATESAKRKVPKGPEGEFECTFVKKTREKHLNKAEKSRSQGDFERVSKLTRQYVTILSSTTEQNVIKRVCTEREDHLATFSTDHQPRKIHYLLNIFFSLPSPLKQNEMTIKQVWMGPSQTENPHVPRIVPLK